MTDEVAAKTAPELSTNARVARLAAVMLGGAAALVGTFALLHFIQPELSPLTRFGSEYAAGTGGWLIRVGFLGFGIGTGAMALAFGATLPPPLRSRAAGILLGLASIGFLGSAVFNSDLQTGPATTQGMLHDLFGFLAFLTMMPAMVAIGGRLRKHDRAGARTWWYWTAWAIIALFLSMLFVFEPLGLVGLGQRMFVLAFCVWFITLARRLRAGSGA